MRSSWLFFLALILTACTSKIPVAVTSSPQITIVPGREVRWPIAQDCACDLVEWTAPTDRIARICVERSKSVEISREDVRAFRIEDRRLGDQTWYLVSVLLTDEAYGQAVRKLRRELPTPPDESCPFEEPTCHTPVAVAIDGEPDVVVPLEEIDEITNADMIVTTTRDISRAESITSGWSVPVTRVIEAEISARPIQRAMLEDLIANPRDFIGKRVAVRGYYGGGELYVSKEQAAVLDHPSPVSVPLASDPEAATPCRLDERGTPVYELGAAPFGACQGEWVDVVAFVDSKRDGSLELTRIEQISSNGTDCRVPPRPK
jgi:hypothetical protein